VPAAAAAREEAREATGPDERTRMRRPAFLSKYWVREKTRRLQRKDGMERKEMLSGDPTDRRI
jgi:hypothetical protein